MIMESRIKIINNQTDYEEALKLIEQLIAKDPDPESEEGEKLNLLTALVKDYESRVFPESLPDPIDAILFRMEQQDLDPKDLVPYIGSRSKVSEVLSRKRPLTVSMMRSLQKGLGIPAKVLLKEPEVAGDVELSWDRFPMREMARRGYFAEKSLKHIDPAAALEAFFKPVGSPTVFLGHLKKSNYRVARQMDKHALIAWSSFVYKTASNIKYPTSYKAGSVNLTLMQEVARLSTHENGPLVAQEFLRKHGIGLVAELHFEKTYLDGATILLNKAHPVIGLTLRYDRLDSFWFTLMHELAHIALHFDQNFNFFYDDLDNPGIGDEKEREADRLAGEALVPESKWEVSPARLIPSAIAANSLAKEIGVHVAIVAGKMRHEGKKYIYLNKIVNQAKVRKYFF